jgi:hypothetical protein
VTKKKPSKKSKPSTKKPVARKKGPRQKQLPGMEDRAIAALDDAAHSYAEARDMRVAASGEEVEAKKHLLHLMHANKRSRYVCGDVYIEIIPEGEKLKVKILKEGEEAPEAAPEPREGEQLPDSQENNEEALTEA